MFFLQGTLLTFRDTWTTCEVVENDILCKLKSKMSGGSCTYIKLNKL